MKIRHIDPVSIVVKDLVDAKDLVLDSPYWEKLQ
jgi:hypothetical protein